MNIKFTVLFGIFFLFLYIPNHLFAANVTGRVIKKRNNQPVSNALIILEINQREVARTITMNDGKYFIRSVPDGFYDVKVISAGSTRNFTANVNGDEAVIDFSIELIN